MERLTVRPVEGDDVSVCQLHETSADRKALRFRELLVVEGNVTACRDCLTAARNEMARRLGRPER